MTNEEIMNNVTMEETAPVETEETGLPEGSSSGGFGFVAAVVGTMLASGFAYMAGCAIGNNLFFDEEAKAKRNARKEARKAKRAEKKARKQNKPVIVDEITIEADTNEE